MTREELNTLGQGFVKHADVTSNDLGILVVLATKTGDSMLASNVEPAFLVKLLENLLAGLLTQLAHETKQPVVLQRKPNDVM